MKEIDYKDIPIIFEDNHILVALKPQNIATCADETKDDNMLDLLKEYLKETYEKTGNAFLGLVHRLDRPTGGVMVFAKTSKAAKRLQESMQKGEFEKKYFAVTIGVPKQKRATLKHALYKNTAKNEVYTVPVTTDGAKLAVLDYRILQDIGTHALVSINLITGRSHQARVQMAAIGTPIFGDQKYGQGKTPIGHNLALWAVELRFPHPVSKEIMVFRIDPPSDLIPWSKFLIPSLF